MVTVTMEVNSLGKLAGNGIAHLRLLLLSSHVLTVSEVVLTVSQENTRCCTDNSIIRKQRDRLFIADHRSAPTYLQYHT